MDTQSPRTPSRAADAQRSQQGASHSSDPLVGVAMMAAAMLYIPGIDAVAKLLGSQGVPPLQTSWMRFVFQMLLLAPITLYVVGIAGMVPKRPGLALLRGVLIALTTVLFFTALLSMPMADSIAIFFVEPLILTVLSAIFLGERIGWRRIAAVAIGFVGAMLIVRPSFADVGYPALLPLAAAFTFALYLLLTKTMIDDENPFTLHLWAGIGGCAFLGGILALGAAVGATSLAPIWPTTEQWLLLALLGVIATSGHFLIMLAFGRAPASLLAPLQYLEIVSATLLGYLIFNDLPTALTWLGIALIVASGMFVFWREQVTQTS